MLNFLQIELLLHSLKLIKIQVQPYYYEETSDGEFEDVTKTYADKL